MSRQSREVYCARTCSTDRCPKADSGECLAYDLPEIERVCIFPACPVITTTRTSFRSTSSVATTTAAAGEETTSTSVADNGAFECLWTSGGGPACLENTRDFCEASCPCCAAKADDGITVPGPIGGGGGGGGGGTATEDTSGLSVDQLSMLGTVLFILAVVLFVGIVLFIGCAIFRASRRAEELRKQQPSKPTPFVKREKKKRKVPEAWVPDGAEEVWTEPVHGFNEPSDSGSSAAAPPTNLGRPQARARRVHPEDGAQQQRPGGAQQREGSDTGGRSPGATPDDTAKAEQFSPGGAGSARAKASASPPGGHQNGRPPGQPQATPPRQQQPGSSPTSGEASPKTPGTASQNAGAGSASPGAGSRSGASAGAPGAANEGGGGPGGGGSPGGAAGGSSSPPPSSNAASPPPAASTPPEGAELVDEVAKDMDETQGKDVEWRKQHFKELMLKWHPDKNRSESPEKAAAVFRYLMGRRDRYLAP